MSLPGSIQDREYGKFRDTESGPAVAVTGTVSGPELSTLVDVVSSSVIYIGAAAPGSASSSAVWLIKKVTVTGGQVSILLANGSSAYNQTWDNRSALTYV